MERRQATTTTKTDDGGRRWRPRRTTTTTDEEDCAPAVRPAQRRWRCLPGVDEAGVGAARVDDGVWIPKRDHTILGGVAETYTEAHCGSAPLPWPRRLTCRLLRRPHTFQPVHVWFREWRRRKPQRRATHTAGVGLAQLGCGPETVQLAKPEVGVPTRSRPQNAASPHRTTLDAQTRVQPEFFEAESARMSGRPPSGLRDRFPYPSSSTSWSRFPATYLGQPPRSRSQPM